MGISADTPAAALSATADVALVVLAALAIIVSIWTFVVQMRSQKPKVTIDVLYYVEAKPRVNDPHNAKFGVRQFTTALTDAESNYRRFAPDYHLTQFLRAVVTNKGGVSVGVEAVGFENLTGQGRYYLHPENPALPFDLQPHRRMQWKELYAELESISGNRRTVRYVVALSNGDKAYSGWIKLHKTPDVKARAAE